MDDRTLRLARMLLGTRPTPAGSIPQPVLPDFQQPGSMMGMMPFMQKGDIPPEIDNPPVMPPVTVQASPLPAAAPAQPMAPPIAEASRQGNYGPAWDVRSDVAAAIKQLVGNGRLPEQWKGAFSNQYGEPT